MKKGHKAKLAISGLFILAVVLMWWGVSMLVDPIRKSEEDIRERLLSNVPIGTHIDDVNTYIAKNKKWSIVSEFYGLDDTGYEGGTDVSLEKGEKGILVDLGSYGFIFRATAEAYLTFDASGNLTDVKVEKHTDAI